MTAQQWRVRDHWQKQDDRMRSEHRTLSDSLLPPDTGPMTQWFKHDSHLLCASFERLQHHVCRSPCQAGQTVILAQKATLVSFKALSQSR
jgi:hypothetical protein